MCEANPEPFRAAPYNRPIASVKTLGQPTMNPPPSDRFPARRLALAAACVALAAGALASGCAWAPPPGMIPPSLSVSDFVIRDVGRDEVRFALTLQAQNPNDYQVPITDLRFELDLLGRPFASGNAVQRKVVLAPNATQPVPVEFTVPTSRLVAFVRDLSLVELTALSYRLKGSASWGDGIFTIPFERRGEFDVLRKFRDALRPLPPR
jgi:LEA14-like dessication related protein